MLRTTTMMKEKIFIGPIEISGYFANLASGMRSLGADVTFITYSKHIFGYVGEDESSLVGFIKWLRSRYLQTTNKNFLIRIFWLGLWQMAEVIFFLTALIRFDVFIFGFGQSLLWRNMDLPILRLFGKKIIFMMGMGSEMRPPYVDGTFQSANGDIQPSVDMLRKLTIRTINRVRRVERYSNFIIGAPYSSTPFSKKMLINSFVFGIPLQHKTTLLTPELNKSSTIVLHTPSHPAGKGTIKIRQVINSLKNQGYKIEFIEIIGRPNAEVLDALKKCDFVIDQLYSDTPMGGLSTEAACFGKPSVVGGYRLHELKKYMPDGMLPPSQLCHPDQLESAVVQLIADHNYRTSLGQKAYDFVQMKWAADKVAERYLRLLSGDIPEKWMLNPNDVVYFHGAGQAESQSKKNIQNLVAEFGVSALQLSHRPDLEQAFLAFADIKT
jgi:hypothetical protein